MAHVIFKRALLASALIALFAVTLIACGGDDSGDGPDPSSTPQPATPTSVPGEPTATPTKPSTSPTIPAGTPKPTAETNDMPGFIAALTRFNKEINGGTVDPLISRFIITEHTCTAGDIAGGAGAVTECKTVGEKVKGIKSSQWRSEGGLRPVDAIVQNLKAYQAGFNTEPTDKYGPGTFRVYAYDPSTTTAVITVTSKCIPQYQCPAAGFQRLVWVLDFEYADAAWKIDSIMYAFVLGEEFLDPPSAEAKQRMPQYTKFQ